MLRSDLCDYSNAYIVLKGPVNVWLMWIIPQMKCQPLRLFLHLNQAYKKLIT